MIEQYRFDDHDRKVIEALQNLLWKVMTAKVLPPAKLISVAKMLHGLWHLPRPTKGISVTIDISFSVQQEGVSGGSSFTFTMAPDSLNLRCGEFSHSKESGSESWATMSWSASPGEAPDNDGSWDEGWLGEPYFDESTIHDLAECTISIEDDDNNLLFDSGSSDEEEDLDIPLVLCREGEKIKLSLKEWRAAILAFKGSGWEPGGDLDVYSTPGIAIGSEDGLAMEEAGNELWRMIDRNPTLAESVDLDIDLFFSLTKFVGRGRFSVRESGACD